MCILETAFPTQASNFDLHSGEKQAKIWFAAFFPSLEISLWYIATMIVPTPYPCYHFTRQVVSLDATVLATLFIPRMSLGYLGIHLSILEAYMTHITKTSERLTILIRRGTELLLSPFFENENWDTTIKLWQVPLSWCSAAGLSFLLTLTIPGDCVKILISDEN